MYTPEQPPAPPGVDAARRPAWMGMPRTVWALGLTSLLTDVSSEMVTSVLPLYVVLHLQWSPMAFGALDGAYQGIASMVRLGGAVVADRFRSHKAVALAGYACSAVAKLGYIAAGASWPALTGALVADRLGKGVRTAPRDALVAASAPAGRMGAAFGLHRTMDAAGAALGPALVFLLLSIAPTRFDAVFLTSFWLALTGVAALALLVDARPGTVAGVPPDTTWARLGEIVRAPGYRGVLIAALVLGAATVGDGFLYLVVQRHSGLEPSRVPLLFVGTHLAYFALAGPAGTWADRRGGRPVYLAGYGGLVLVYALLALGAGGAAMPWLCVTLLGAYYAATDGVLSALTARVVPQDLRATAIGLLTTGTTAGRALAALAFGALWTFVDARLALALFAAALIAAMALASRTLPRLAGPASEVRE
jgi:MFS family permease